jgi:hypothetical protein
MRGVRCVALAVALALLLGACGRWTLVASPNPTSPTSLTTGDSLGRVSCPGPSFCVAVGALDTEYDVQPLIESGPAANLSADSTPSVDRGALGTCRA